MLYQLFLKVTFTLSEREYWFPVHEIYDPFFSFQGRMSSMASHIMGKQHKNDIRNLWKIFSVIFNIFPRTAISNGFISNMFDRRSNKQNVFQGAQIAEFLKAKRCLIGLYRQTFLVWTGLMLVFVWFLMLMFTGSSLVADLARFHYCQLE